MKKTLAIAIAAGLAAPMAVMADTTLYGSIHQSLDIIDLDQTGVSDNISTSNNKSYLGVKGSEKISDGLKAVYKIEFGPQVGGGGSTLGNRDQYVGLSGNYGTLVSGRASTPYKIVGAKADLFWFSQLGSNRNMTGPNVRSDNVIAYFTPKMGGFSASVAHVTEGTNSSVAGSTPNDNFDAWSANAFYKAGGLMVGAGYETLDGALDEARLMASYDTGKVKVVGFIEDIDVNGTAVGDSDTWGLGASMKTAKGVVKGQYYASDVNGFGDASLFAIGYDHNLSKRTTIYAQYAAIDNDTASGTDLGTGFALGGGGAYGLDSGGHSETVPTTAPGQDQSGISIGIKHDF